jgi:hypothetical protein
MAFADFKYTAKVLEDHGFIWTWCDARFGTGHWGKMISLTGAGATYCFEYEKDLTLFLLRWSSNEAQL